MFNASYALLSRRWLLLVTLGGLSLVLGYAVMASPWGRNYTFRWVLIAGALLLYQLAYLHRHLRKNHRDRADELLPNFGPGTYLTIARGMMIAWTGGFLFSPRPTEIYAWLPMSLYTVAIILDLFDGYAARVSDHQTLLGELLDNELDALGLLVAISLAVWYQVLPLWFVPIGFARYVFQWGMEVRKRAQKPTYPLPESRARRPIAGFTMGFISAMLWPIVSHPESTIAGVLFLLPFTFSFTRDWLVVSGAIDPSSPSYQQARAMINRVLFQWTPLVMRLISLLALISILTGWLDDWAASDLLTAPSQDRTILMVGLLAVTLGIAGRFAAFILIFPIAFTIIDHGLAEDLLILLLFDLGILLLGTGRLSLWDPETRIFGRRWGEKDARA